MALIGRDIIQTIKPINDKLDENIRLLNHKEVFPRTVFDAVRQDMHDENSVTLSSEIDRLDRLIQNRQIIFPALPANYLMTFTGQAGGVSGIQITRSIPWDPKERTHDRIPTEKAVSDLLKSLGLVNEYGVPDPDGRLRVRWSDIINRPILYREPGDNDDGFMTQRATTNAIRDAIVEIEESNNAAVDMASRMKQYLKDHLDDLNNPHAVTPGIIGAVTQEDHDTHVFDKNNPHETTQYHVGLGSVDNTSDMDKPISIATQNALDIINTLIQDITQTVGGFNFVSNITYDRLTGILRILFRDGTYLDVFLPSDRLIYDIRYDIETKDLLLTRVDKTVCRVSLEDLFIRYLGSVNAHITVEIDGNQITGNQIINAAINPQSITDEEMADQSIIERILADWAVTTDKIADLTVTTEKLADGSVTTVKLSELSVTTTRLADRSVTGRKLFTSSISNRILAVINAMSDPVWTRVTGDMIQPRSIVNLNMARDSIGAPNIMDNSIRLRHMGINSVATENIIHRSVTGNSIALGTITGSNISEDIVLPGTPSISIRPALDAENSQIPDTAWVRHNLDTIEIDSENLSDRVVDGRSLFSSNESNRVLLVLDRMSDAVWGRINQYMMDDDSVSTRSVMNESITEEKLTNNSISSRTVIDEAVLRRHIRDNAVNGNKLWPSDRAFRVIASLEDNANPVYTQVLRGMIANEAISTDQIEYMSIDPNRISPSDISMRVLATATRGTEPLWTQVRGQMIADRTVDGRSLFSSPVGSRILAVTTPDADPQWLQVSGSMIQDRAISHMHLLEDSVRSEHIKSKTINFDHIEDWTIRSNNIAPRAITGTELFTSPLSNRILAVDSMPYSNPQWLQVQTDMVEDEAITGDKMFRSRHPHRVLLATDPHAPPEYQMITSKFVVDHSIIGRSLEPNIVLQGTPEIVVRPEPDARNSQVPDTRWVLDRIQNAILNSEIVLDSVSPDMIPDNTIELRHLNINPPSGISVPRVLGVTNHDGRPPEWILVEEDLIVNGAVTQDKLGRDLTLWGSPSAEVHPTPNSGIYNRDTTLATTWWVRQRISDILEGNINWGGPSSGMPLPIPTNLRIDDHMLQWNRVTGATAYDVYIDGVSLHRTQNEFLNLISLFLNPGQTYSFQVRAIGHLGDIGDPPIDNNPGWGPGPGGTPGDDSITSEMLRSRSITGRELMSSGIPDVVLSVLDANTDPIFSKINNRMLNNRVIDGRALFSSQVANRVLAVGNAGDDPHYSEINIDMMGLGSIGPDQLRPDSVDSNHIVRGSVLDRHLANSPIIDTHRIVDRSVTGMKIALSTIEGENIDSGAITGINISENIILPLHPTVPAHNTHSRRSLRNTILSPNNPDSTGQNGDIWFQFF